MGRDAVRVLCDAMMEDPLVLTLELDPANQARFEAERRQHFPRALNRIPAHVSLFHALPGSQLGAATPLLAAAAASAGSFAVEVHDIMRLGRGVAYMLRSDLLHALHSSLRAAWLPWLTPQDRQGFRPHIVVQNKVAPAEAQALFTKLSRQFRPWTAAAASLRLWHYRGGPWEPAGTFPFPESRSL